MDEILYTIKKIKITLRFWVVERLDTATSNTRA